MRVLSPSLHGINPQGSVFAARFGLRSQAYATHKSDSRPPPRSIRTKSYGNLQKPRLHSSLPIPLWHKIRRQWGAIWIPIAAPVATASHSLLLPRVLTAAHAVIELAFPIWSAWCLDSVSRLTCAHSCLKRSLHRPCETLLESRQVADLLQYTQSGYVIFSKSWTNKDLYCQPDHIAL